MTIAAHLHCADCRCPFAVTKRQRHDGLLASVVRCPPCRIRRRRRGQATWIRRKRALAICRPESAPVHAPRLPAPASRRQASLSGVAA